MNAPTMHGQAEGRFLNPEQLDGHLAHAAFRALSQHPGRILVVDCGLQRRVMSRGFVLVLSWLLSKQIAQWTDKPRVAVVLPPSLGATIANLAITFAGKVPVNLNFTLGSKAAAACLRKADVDCLLSAAAVRARMPDFVWPEQGVLDLVEVVRGLSKVKAVLLSLALRLLPAGSLAKWLKVPTCGGEREAALLFTSGSSGMPKAVALSHRNVLGNCAQIRASGLLPAGERVIANLPLFHSFGFTVTLWYLLLGECRLITLPTPLDVKKTVATIEAEAASVLIGTPTFLKPYLQRAEAKQLASLRLVVAGAEPTPPNFARQWEDRFGCIYLEGYGITEASPVVSVNSPQASRAGSVGRLLPGIQARILNPDTHAVQSIELVGLLALKGPNIFRGYLEDPQKTAEVLQDGWLLTGDLARFDADGFLYIEGRLARFSKIAGEMVPHGTVEHALNVAFDLLTSEVPQLAVAGRPDPEKGEVLVLLSTFDLSLQELRQKLSAAGIANLWIPKAIRRVKAIPTLATGKLDLKTIQQIARDTDHS